MTITITVTGPVYITMQPGASSPLGGTLGQVALKEGESVAQEGTINTEQRVMASIHPTTDAGNPAQVDGVPLWSVESGACTLSDVEPADPNRRWINSGPTLGDSVVQCLADADLGAGVVQLAETFLIHVENPMATHMGGSLGVPELKPTA